MCTQHSPNNWSRELYQRHGETIENYLRTTVLPALSAKSGEGGTILLTELQHRWSNHEIMNRWLQKFFTYLDRYYVKTNSLPTLSRVGLLNFRTTVYEHVKQDATAAILELINDEREGKIIDTTLVKSIVELYENMGMGSLDAYNADLEEPLLSATREYYAKKRQEWIDTDSTPDYVKKFEAAIHEEKNRVADYLNPSSGPKILKVCEEEILGKVKMVLLEKDSTIDALLVSPILLEKDSMIDTLHVSATRQAAYSLDIVCTSLTTTPSFSLITFYCIDTVQSR